MSSLPQLNDSNFRSTVNQEPAIIVHYTATWCGVCRSLQHTIESLEQEYRGRVRIVEVDIDDSPETSTAEHVRAVPYTVLYKKGEAFSKIVGAKDRRVYRELAENV